MSPTVLERRRKFLGRMVWGIISFLGTCLAAILAAPFFKPLFAKRHTEWLDVADINQLTETPQRFEVQFEHTQGWMTEPRTETCYALLEGGKAVVFSSTCTHLGCSVSYDRTSRHFKCPCHGGEFDDSGQVVAGPPPAPLKRLTVDIKKDRLLVQRT